MKTLMIQTSDDKRTDCVCEKCPHCHNIEEKCSCEECPHCWEKTEDCTCEICEECNKKEDDCTCEKCEYCEEKDCRCNLMDWDQVIDSYNEGILPWIKKEYEQDGIVDKPARDEEFNNYVDSLHRDQQITSELRDNITHDDIYDV